MLDKIIKKYSWYDFSKAMEESGKSLAELFDFKTGTLIWRDTPNKAHRADPVNRAAHKQR